MSGDVGGIELGTASKEKDSYERAHDKHDELRGKGEPPRVIEQRAATDEGRKKDEQP